MLIALVNYRLLNQDLDVIGMIVVMTEIMIATMDLIGTAIVVSKV